MGGLTLGVFAVILLGASATLITKFGPPAIFEVFAAVTAVAAAIATFFFPSASISEDLVRDAAGFTRPVWFIITGIVLMSLVQAMIFSFLQPMGTDRGLSPVQIQSVLVTLGLVAMTPTLLAAFLQKRLPPMRVAMTGTLLQGAVAVLISCSSGFLPYAVGAVVFPFIMLFTHTFVFGHLARLDLTGRAVAATPAMLVGNMIGPLLGGTLVQTTGYLGLGSAAAAVDLIALCCFIAASQRATSAIQPLPQLNQ
ncbi:hypothetical protein XH83_38140 (plasmid) [Bradyrhizobium sp. CCBAU 53351]|uniref:MFS transporter n=2 Tax=Bradyrhizobium TaxID=374 RepID=A0AAE5X948_9BRAD|nr:hypothetical protein X265_37855 [Bradyrhizobium guangdongense]QAU50898.1 hypothetical protein XH91_37055 [Bradyrhizobium guangzhouense]QOZ49513.1 hypothetical protein XH89_39205 [Bradyrhizobium sp. CCBAU 53340]QOZ56630.1 hypothetical protein XH90_35000 [Bradyrhizobium sp. CCBAU 53338]QOZ81272.1 hypothetical protein XH83_38140 [Bradyrhizobium sp. CCBAU 53351]